jgi:hypothetical protein
VQAYLLPPELLSLALRADISRPSVEAPSVGAGPEELLGALAVTRTQYVTPAADTWEKTRSRTLPNRTVTVTDAKFTFAKLCRVDACLCHQDCCR